MLPKLRHDRLLSKSFTNIQSFDALWSEIMAVSLNKLSVNKHITSRIKILACSGVKLKPVLSFVGCPWHLLPFGLCY
jgi:hypothetical protein